MGRYILQKVGGAVLTALVVSLITFVILQVLPGDPAILMLGTEGNPAAYTKLRVKFHLDDPLPLRYGRWLLELGRGRLGESWRYGLPVSTLIGDVFPLTLGLAFLGMLLAFILALPAGVFMAAKPLNWGARLLSLLSQVSLTFPQFWLGLLLIQFWAVRWRLLPAGGPGRWVNFILPAVTLALPRAAILARLLRVGLAEALHQDYVRTARAKGAPPGTVLFKHALRNGALSVLTVAGLQFAQLLAGTIVVEQVFGLPGLGQLLLAAVFQRDIPLVQALVLLSVVLILAFELCFDLGLGVLDPRLRYE